MDNKAARIMSLYNRLLSGEVIIKADEADRFKTTGKTIQRDLEDIRSYLAKEGDGIGLVYDRRKKGYVLVKNANTLTNSVCKEMPPKRHSQPNRSFDIKKSEVVKWLIQHPDVLSWLFEYIKNTGYIVFDPNTGMWRGKDYNM